MIPWVLLIQVWVPFALPALGLLHDEKDPLGVCGGATHSWPPAKATREIPTSAPDSGHQNLLGLGRAIIQNQDVREVSLPPPCTMPLGR